MNVLTIGTFDLFHFGHVRLLAACRGLVGSGEVVVGVNPDDFVAAYKGRPPVVPLAGRMEVVRACRYVDRVLESSGRSCLPLIDQVRPDIIAVGSDWERRDYLAQIGVPTRWLQQHRIRIEYLPYTEGISSSRLRAAR